MPKRAAGPVPYELPKKKSSGNLSNNGVLKQGECIVDNAGKKWKLGKTIGIGGFGEIYDVSEHGSNKEFNNQSFVAKIEKHTNGPLFVEINCYLRLGKLNMIQEWKENRDLNFLGLPYFVASGSHYSKGDKYRFLIMPKYHQDLEAIFQVKKLFNLKTVLVIATRIIDTLEYIHSHGYVHSDIKASNIMLGHNQVTHKSRNRTPVRKLPCRNLKGLVRPIVRTCGRSLRPITNHNYIDDIPYLEEVLKEYESGRDEKNRVPKLSNPKHNSEFNGDPIYLLDYGLATKYLLSNGKHREFSSDQRRAHAGTVLFCSRDAHKGVQSRRSDLESLGYNMIYWLTGTLPWIDDINEPEIVEKKKNKFFTDVKMFLGICFEDCPRFLVELFENLKDLKFQDTPDYNFFRQLFKKTIREYGYKDDSKLDFDNLEGWGRKQKKTGKCKANKKENVKIFKRPSLLLYSPRLPLSSNIIFKRPKLRKKIKDKLVDNSMMNWSRILMDPETIIKQAHRKTADEDRGFNICDMDIDSLNPTPAMRDVFNKVLDREDRSPFGSRGDEPYCGDDIEGYTPEMMRVYRRMKEQQEIEFERVVQQSLSTKKRNRKRVKRSESPIRTANRQTKNDGPARNIQPLKKVKSIPLKRTYSLRG
ncbi:serine/threonine-protein kinase VRK1-like [Sitophilus oryzae]|uniref:non-specific serine/threonine protein kinase n=1 Tax=Sitophilus oryzae TaxID=7048 RepID=A0A6J2XXN1_SITOR|nr:serine/threonine-protein kinase VRK1-like [Sitophilus oryzae]